VDCRPTDILYVPKVIVPILTFNVPKLDVPKKHVTKVYVPKLPCTESDLPLSNGFDNRVERTAVRFVQHGCHTGLLYNRFDKPRLVHKDTSVFAVIRRKDVTLGSLVDNAAHLRRQIPPKKNLHCGVVNWHFQAKLVDCGWTAVCRLQVYRFLPTADEVLSAGMAVCYARYSLPVITGRKHGYVCSEHAAPVMHLL